MADRIYQDGKVFEEIDLDVLDKEELIEIIEDMNEILEDYQDDEEFGDEDEDVADIIKSIIDDIEADGGIDCRQRGYKLGTILTDY